MMNIDPVPLFFAAGLAAGALRVDLRFPEGLHEGLSLYLLLALGLKGGMGLAQTPGSQLLGPALAALLLAISIPFLAFAILRALRYNQDDAGALAAHYGSVSVATFAVSQAYLSGKGFAVEGAMAFCLVLMESPALIVGVTLARGGKDRGLGKDLLHEILLSKPIFLLGVGLLVGSLVPASGLQPIEPLFKDLFKGLLCLFLLEMGVAAAMRLADLKERWVSLVAFGTLMPLFNGCVGVAFGHAIGLGIGGAATLGTLAASASYIAAPATARAAIPKANPALYLTGSLGVTFPFNVLVGIPLYTALAQRLAA